METDPVKYIFITQVLKRYFIAAERKMKKFDGELIFAGTV